MALARTGPLDAKGPGTPKPQTTYLQGEVAFGRYLITEVHPCPNSTIYKATDSSSGRIVAVKEVNIRQYGGKWKREELTRREFYAGVNLDHPNLPRYHECYGDPKIGDFFQVRDWAEGESLHDLLQKGVRLSGQQLSVVISSVLDAVKYLHGFPDPIIHRDIKPNNIIVNLKEREIRGVVLIDLDAIAKASGSPERGWTTHIYTPGFMAPEALSRPCQQSDLFSVGAVMLYVLSGHDADYNYNIRKAAYVLPPALALVKDSKQRNFLRQSLEPSPDKRFQSAEEMKAALEKLKSRERALVPVERQREIADGIKQELEFDEYEVRKIEKTAYVFQMACAMDLFSRLYKPNQPFSSLALNVLLSAFGGFCAGIFAFAPFYTSALSILAVKDRFSSVSAANRLMSGDVTDPEAQETIAKALSGVPKTRKLVRKARRILSSPIHLSEQAETELAKLITKKKHAEGLLEANSIRSAPARAELLRISGPEHFKRFK